MTTETFEKLTPENYPSQGLRQDEDAVRDLAKAMKLKLMHKRDQGFGGWNSPHTSNLLLSSQLLHRVMKGDPIDVANYCAFLQTRKSKIQLVDGGVYETLLAVFMEASTFCTTLAQTPERTQSLERLRKLVTLS